MGVVLCIVLLLFVLLCVGVVAFGIREFEASSYSFTKSLEEWEAFKGVLEKSGYEVELLRVERSCWRGYVFVYSMKKRK